MHIFSRAFIFVSSSLFIILSLCLVNNSWLKFFANMSAVFNLDLTKIILTVPISTYSLMKCCLTDIICLVCWLKTGLFVRNIAPILSTLPLSLDNQLTY